jgi:hypothetical protein
MKLDPDRVVTIGRHGPVSEASNWADPPDLTRSMKWDSWISCPAAATAPEGTSMSPRSNYVEGQ